MLLYIEWKFDFNKQNKIHILNISQNKNPSIKYDISKEKYLLCDETRYADNFIGYVDNKIYNTRIKIGKIQSGKLLILSHLTQTPLSSSIRIYLYGCKSTMVCEIKTILCCEKFLDMNNHHIIDDETEENKILKNLTKDLIQSGEQTYYNKNNDKFILSLGTNPI
jgi:hypothetical protein